MKKILVMLVAAAAISACASEPTLDTSADAELSFDGLVPVKRSRFQRAWADPDVDFKSYDSIMLGPAYFEFRAVKKTPRTSSMRRMNEDEFWISDENQQKLIDTVTEIFAEELSSTEGFTVTDQRGPNTLIITGGLHDIVSEVPPEYIGASTIYLSSVGEATLIVEARDSLSGETIFRGIDRSNIESGANTMVEANPVTTWAEVRRWARRWGARLRSGLESIHE